MYNECFSHMSKALQKDKMQEKMNSYLNISVYNLISPSNIKYENKINNQ